MTDRSGRATEWFSEIGVNFDTTYYGRCAGEARLALWSDFIERYSSPTGRAVDLGCGTGVLTFLLARANREALGIDGSDEMVAVCERKRQARQIDNVAFCRGDLDSLSSADIGNSTLIISSSVIEYVYDAGFVLDQIVGALAKGGTLLLSVPNEASLRRRLEPLAYRLTGRPAYMEFSRHKFLRREIVRALENRGLTVLETRYFSASWASRVARPLGLESLSESMILLAARKNS